VIGFQELHALTMFVFTQVPFGYAWVWFGFGMILWFSTAALLLGPIQSRAYKLSQRVYYIFMVAANTLIIADV
jgi:hypothetical protein